MEQTRPKKSINFGARGWLLILWVATACLSYVIGGNYPLNIMADVYGGAQTLSLVYTISCIIGIIIQVIVSRKTGAIKSWKRLSIILGIVTVIFILLIMILQPGTLWIICYGLATVLSMLYGTWATYVLVGSWFPTRKGTVMGIITFAFPIANALIGVFATNFFGSYGASMATADDQIGALIATGTDPEAAVGIVSNAAAQPAAFSAMLPFLIVVVVGLIIGAIFISEFPEQVGAYRDNDKNMTPEIAQAMMKAEEENRKSTVWTTGHTFASPDFWCITIPMGILLMFAVGAMTQTNAMISPYEEIGLIGSIGGYSSMMLFIAGAGIVGSYIFGLIDTKKGTRFAVALSMVFMLVSGILGAIANGTTLFFAFILLGMFMGASSNYTISAAVQYWRLEDFPSVFSVINPVANLFNCLGPVLVANLITTSLGTGAIFIAAAIGAVISIILCIIFKPARIKAYDDKYRTAAGKPLDDALVGRK